MAVLVCVHVCAVDNWLVAPRSWTVPLLYSQHQPSTTAANADSATPNALARSSSGSFEMCSAPGPKVDLTVVVIRAKEIDARGHILDPYVEVDVEWPGQAASESRPQRTAVVRNADEPFWGKEMSFSAREPARVRGRRWVRVLVAAARP